MSRYSYPSVINANSTQTLWTSSEAEPQEAAAGQSTEAPKEAEAAAPATEAAAEKTE
jgi:hypothetical protein